jgi:hypothetical protein
MSYFANPQSNSLRTIYRFCAIAALAYTAVVLLDTLRTLPHYDGRNEITWAGGFSVRTENVVRDMGYLYLMRLGAVIPPITAAFFAGAVSRYAPFSNAMSYPTNNGSDYVRPSGASNAFTVAAILVTIGAAINTLMSFSSMFAALFTSTIRDHPALAAQIIGPWPLARTILGLLAVWGLTVLAWTLRGAYLRSGYTPIAR